MMIFLSVAMDGQNFTKRPKIEILTSEFIFEHAPFADGFANDTLQHPCRNPVLYKKANDNIVLFYKIGPTRREWWGMYKISFDNGKKAGRIRLNYRTECSVRSK
ncbi:MAG: exo-alpha-sialidase [Dysgonomonadaceae bacterium]|nr:exo-alpha-sialidase [Dysgonamonadaceae bacterium]